MAIAFDAVTEGGFNSASFSHTCSGTNRILFVVTTWLHSSDADPTGITYNGVAMTKLDSAYQANDSRTVSLWYLVNPASGSNTVAVSGTPSTGQQSTAISYNGVLQSAPTIFQVGENVGAGTSRVGSVTTVSANNWLVMCANATSENPAAGTGATLRDQGSVRTALFDSGGTVAVGSVSMTVTFASAESCYIILAISPSITIAADSGSYTLTGSDASFIRSLRLVADSGSYAITGVAAIIARVFTEDAGSFTLTGSGMIMRRFKPLIVRGTSVTTISVRGTL